MDATAGRFEKALGEAGATVEGLERRSRSLPQAQSSPERRRFAEDVLKVSNHLKTGFDTHIKKCADLPTTLDAGELSPKQVEALKAYNARVGHLLSRRAGLALRLGESAQKALRRTEP